MEEQKKRRRRGIDSVAVNVALAMSTEEALKVFCATKGYNKSAIVDRFIQEGIARENTNSAWGKFKGNHFGFNHETKQYYRVNPDGSHAYFTPGETAWIGGVSQQQEPEGE